jgi:TIR domain
MSKLFISYKHGTDGIQKFIEALEKTGYKYWIDSEQLRIGNDWRNEAKKAIEEAVGFIVCLSHEACDSSAVQFEVETARDLSKPIFPINFSRDSTPLNIDSLNLSTHIIRANLGVIDNWEQNFKKFIIDMNHHSIVPSVLSQYEGIKNFNQAFMAKDYSSAHNWLHRIQQIDGYNPKEFDCKIYERIVDNAIEQAIEEDYWQEIFEQYNLIGDLSTYAPYSEVWNWLQDFFQDSERFPDDKGIEAKIRNAVGIESLNLKLDHNDSHLNLQWTMPKKAKKIKLTQITLGPATYVTVDGYGALESYEYIDENGARLSAYHQTWEFDRNTQNLVVDIKPESLFIYELTCEYADQYGKPLYVNEPSVNFPAHKKYRREF